MRKLLVIMVAVPLILYLLIPAGPEPGEAVDMSHGAEMSQSADEELAAKSPELSAVEISSLPRIPFVNVTAESGLTFRHDRGLSQERLLPETMGSGCAVIDIDGDGLQDVVFVSSRAWDWDDAADPTQPRSTLSAWKNLGGMTFREVTADVGLNLSLYGMGAAAGDYDNDGDRDLYITAVGQNMLLRNDDGIFVDVTEATGTAGSDALWSSSAGWLDYDLDGDLDLVVGNYVQWTRQLEQVVDAITFAGESRFGSPDVYPGQTPCLFRNDGGVFVDVAQSVGLTEETKTLGVAFLDANEDGRLDIFFANDGVNDQLYLARSDGEFRESGVTSGVAVGGSGSPRAGMGIDIADFRNDGSVGIAIGQYENEMTGLFVSLGGGLFSDQALSSGIGRDSLPDLTWGVRWQDFDLDGRLDLITTNGHVEQSPLHLSGSAYLQSAQIYWNAGPDSEREFVPLPAACVGDDLYAANSGRAMATADFDNDGDVDIITCNSGRDAQVFRNDTLPQTAPKTGTSRPYWVQLQIAGDGLRFNSDAIGATIHIRAGDTHQRRLLTTARGYLSSCSERCVFGLSEYDDFDVQIDWPDGTSQTLDSLPANQLHRLTWSPTPAENASVKVAP